MVDCPTYGIYYPLDKLPMDVRKKLYAVGRRFHRHRRRYKYCRVNLEIKKRNKKMLKLFLQFRKKCPLVPHITWPYWEKIRKQFPDMKKYTIHNMVNNLKNKKIRAY